MANAFITRRTPTGGYKVGKADWERFVFDSG